MKNGKKWLSRIVILLMAAMLLMPLTASAATVKLNKSTLTLKKGKSYTLKLNNASGKVTWSTSKKSVATVNKNGKVTAKKKGTATITAKAGGKKYKCKVTVKQPVTNIKLNQKNIAISKGKSYTLKATVTPSNANNKAVSWSSSDKSVVTVTSKGVIKSVNPGTAVITAKAKDGSGKKATCKIMVKSPTTSTTDANKTGTVMEINKPSLSLTVGKSSTLKVSNAAGKTLVWVSADTAVATVSSSGKVTAKKAGKTVIVAREVGGEQSVTCYVTVTAASGSSSNSSTEQSGPTAKAQQFLSILEKISNQVKADKAAGIRWGYSNSSSLAPSTWEKAYSASRSKGISYCNCALLPRWALREMGVINSKNFWGLVGGGIQFRGDVKEQLLKHCEIIKVYKTPNQLLKEGNLLPGDICTYVEYQHTNVYAGDGKFYDSGRNGSIGGYQNGTFIFNSFGPAATVSMSNTTIGHIIRFK